MIVFASEMVFVLFRTYLWKSVCLQGFSLDNVWDSISKRLFGVVSLDLCCHTLSYLLVEFLWSSCWLLWFELVEKGWLILFVLDQVRTHDFLLLRVGAIPRHMVVEIIGWSTFNWWHCSNFKFIKVVKVVLFSLLCKNTLTPLQTLQRPWKTSIIVSAWCRAPWTERNSLALVCGMFTYLPTGFLLTKYNILNIKKP